MIAPMQLATGLIDRVEKAEAPQMLCMSCGTVSRDGACHCTVDGSGARVAVNRMEWYAKQIENNDAATSQLKAENSRLRALLARAGEALKWFEDRGCPDCGGDCASANPPISMCIMRTARAVDTEIEEALK